MGTLKAASAYFALVFSTGFVLGVIRVTWLAPWLGERSAELVETPFMLLAVFLAARIVVSSMSTRAPRSLLGVGALALGFMVLSEAGVVLLIRHESLTSYVSSRDPVSGSVYLCSLAVFAVAPSLVATLTDTHRR